MIIKIAEYTIKEGTPYAKKFMEALYPRCEKKPVFTDLTEIEV